MANPNKSKGTRAETKVVKFLEANGIHAKRKALTGSQDCGDVDVETSRGKFVLEVKTGKQTSNPNRSTLAEWMRQTKLEGENSGAMAFLVVVRYNRKIEDADVWWWKSKPDIWNHMYLDSWCNRFG